MAKARRSTFSLLLSISLCIAPGFLYAQTCPNSSSCNAVVGSLAIPNSSTDTSTRVVHAEEASPDGLFTDDIIGFSSNRSWNNATGFTRDDITQPMTWLGLESYWNRSTELNIDISPANSTADLRPFGFFGKYDGSLTALGIGGAPYAPGAGGVRLMGGTNAHSLVAIQARAGSSSGDEMLEMVRQDGTDSFAWRAGVVPRLNFSLATSKNAAGFGNYGMLKFAGEWDFGEPLMEFEGLGTEAMLLNSYPKSTDTNPRFILFADGDIDWGSGAAPADTDLYRSATGTLRTDGSLIVGANLMVMGSKAALVQTASYGKREVYAVESPGEWFEDFGTATLVHGQAVIRIDSMFGETVNTADSYHVFLTANGPCSLYVVRKQPAAFMVKSLRGSMSCRFDYRVIAKRKGYENVRLAEIPNEK
jgi:hypothetical protein